MLRKNLTKGNISKLTLSLAIPLIASNVFGTIFELIDAIFIGKLGSEALAGVAMSGVVLFFLATFGIGLNIGTVSLIARFTGLKNFKQADKTAEQAFLVGIVVSFFLSVTGYIFAPKILSMLGAEGKVLSYGTPYIRILLLGIYTMFFLFLGSAVLRGTGDAKTPMKIIIFSVLLNIILDWVLIFGKFGFPALGTKGAALATVISRGIGGAILIMILFKGTHNIHLKYKSIKPDFSIIREIFKIGIPASVQMFIRSSSSIILIKLVSLFGTATIAGYGICGRLFTLFLLPGFGFADAAQTMVGQNLGAGKPLRARKSALISVFYYSLVLIVLCSLTFIFSKPVIKIFNKEIEVVTIGSLFLRFTSISALFLSVGLVFSRVFQGAGDSITPMIITAFSLYVFQIPMAYVFGIILDLKQTGIGMAMPLSSFLHALMISLFFLKGKWMRRKI